MVPQPTMGNIDYPFTCTSKQELRRSVEGNSLSQNIS